MAANLEDSWAQHWDLQRPYNFNHGSFGATPKAVLSKKSRLESEIHSEREKFIREGGFDLVEHSRKSLAAFVGAHEDNIVLTTNVTESINSVLKSLMLKFGDEVIITPHIYSNYKPLLEDMSRRQGFKVITADHPYRISETQIIDGIISCVTANTKLVIVDHITSHTACIFPVKEIVKSLQARGIDCFVDGAHAPGQLQLDLEDIGAAYYGGNNHKWLCAPLSSGFLYVRADKQADIVPCVGSGYVGSANSFVDKFSWQGSIDFSPRAVIADTLITMEDFHPEGWPGIYRRNHDLAVAARALLCTHLNITPPVSEDMIGCMFTLPLGPLSSFNEDVQLNPHLYGYNYMVEKFGFGVVFKEFQGECIVRVSCALYNKISDYEVLADSLKCFMRDHSR